MKIDKKSVYQDVQNIFNKICRMKIFECAQVNEKTIENVNFWHYVWCECLNLMKEAKQTKNMDRSLRGSFSLCKGKFMFDEMTYCDVSFLGEKKIVDKKMFVNYALGKAYCSFSVFDNGMSKESNIFADNLKSEKESNIFAIAKKMMLLEFILVTQKEPYEREVAVRKLFSA